MAGLAIVRHGEAGHGSPDSDRRLTPRGEREARAAGKWLATRPELTGAMIWVSPYRRAQQTARAIAEMTGHELETVDTLTPDDDVDVLIDGLTILDVSRPLIIVSHMPLVGTLTGRLVEGGANSGVAFPTAGIALLDADVWAAGCATLKTFVGPPHE